MRVFVFVFFLSFLKPRPRYVQAAESLDDLATPEAGERQCVWPLPPKNGVNYRQCGGDLKESGMLQQRLCKETAGTLKSPGVTKFTECQTGHVMTEGERQAHCVNGSWTGDWDPGEYKCIECGRSLLEEETVILKGNKAELGDFPWMAALFYKNYEDKWETKCGGTLITAHMVLTAAHCIKWKNSSTASHENILVGLGKLLTDPYYDEKNSVIKKVREVIVKERYIGIALNYADDIAILDLETSVETNKYIMPACVDWKGKMTPEPEEIGYLAGYGEIESGHPSDSLKWSKQEFKNYSECLKQIPSLKTKLFTADKFCVVSVAGRSAMPGDSGGGLTFFKEDVHYVYGVVSVRIPKASDNQDIVLFTSVMDQRVWLNEQWRRLRPLHEDRHNKKIQSRGEHAVVPRGRNNVCRYLGQFFNQPSNSCEVSHSGSWTAVRPGEFPFWAVVGSSNFEDWNHAILISERYLLTEALYLVRLGLLRISLTEALLGTYHPKQRAAVERFRIVKTILHPQYNLYPAEDTNNRFYDNIALLRLDRVVIFSKQVRPICFHNTDLSPGSEVVLPGEIKPSNVLNKESTQISVNRECDPENQFSKIACVRVENGKIIWGQNGMPLLVRMQDSPCDYGLVGLSNYHLTYSPDIRGYTKMSPYFGWIKSVVRQQ